MMSFSTARGDGNLSSLFKKIICRVLDRHKKIGLGQQRAGHADGGPTVQVLGAMLMGGRLGRLLSKTYAEEQGTAHGR